MSKDAPKAKPVLTVELDGQTVEVPADVEIDQDDVTTEDIINQVVLSRQRPENVSYYAFTATPKAKTMELFGRPGPEGTPVPFHLYSMRQAIEEGFILDVLKNYRCSSSQTTTPPCARCAESLAKALVHVATWLSSHHWPATKAILTRVEDGAS